MDSDIEIEKKDASSNDKPLDEVDFKSGYETQYKLEYRPLRPVFVPPPDKKNAWFRDCQTIFLVLLLTALFIGGNILLIDKFITPNPIYIVFLITAFVLTGVLYVYMEAKSAHLR